MQARVSSIFDGLSEEQLSRIKSNLPRRRFAAGSTVVAEGDSLRELYVVESGAADVFISDRLGEHRINRVGAGTTLGDMSLFTGQAASATVRAATDLDVLVLSDTEFRLLSFLVANAGRVVGHSRIIEHVWGSEHVNQTSYLRTYIGLLRRKIERDPQNPRIIVSSHGIGYKFEIDQAPPPSAASGA